MLFQLKHAIMEKEFIPRRSDDLYDWDTDTTFDQGHSGSDSDCLPSWQQ